MFRALLQRTGRVIKQPIRGFSDHFSITSNTLPKIEFSKFMNSWKTVVTPDLLAYTRSIDIDDIGTAWYNKALQHTVAVGEPTVGFVTAYTYKLLSDQPEDTKLAHILGWCAEMISAASQVHDDICDQGTIRRGLPAWYTLEGVGPAATYDGLLISQGCYHLFEKYFKEKDYYLELLSNFHSTEFHTAFSVSLELRIQRRNVLTFTEENLNTIVNRKVWISFLPLACGMYLTGWKDPEAFRKVREIAMMGGALYQTQDDFIDVYGDPLVTGKLGSDIQTNKCTWFSVTANRLASEQQKKILGECYGSQDPEKVARIMGLFDDLQLLERYKDYERTLYENILQAIQSSNLGQMETALIATLDQFNRRIK